MGQSSSKVLIPQYNKRFQFKSHGDLKLKKAGEGVGGWVGGEDIIFPT